MTGSADEIGKIERELDHLRERYATFQQVAIWAPQMAIVACLALAGSIVWQIFLGDILGAAWFMIGLVFFVVFALQWFQKFAVWVPRIIIVAGLMLAGIIVWQILLGDIFGAAWFMFGLVFLVVCALQYHKQRPIDVISMPGFGTNAREVERMIAEREERLAELKGRAL